MRTMLIALILLIPQRHEASNLLDYTTRIHIVAGETEGSGSGVYIQDQVILTAAHISLEGARYYLDDAHTQEVAFVAMDKSVDLMLLLAKGKHKSVKIGPKANRLDIVHVVGYPMGKANVIIEGRIADQTPDQLLIDATVIQGMSGGGVFKDGRLIGITVMAWGDDDTKLMVAVSQDAIKKFVKGLQVNPK